MRPQLLDRFGMCVNVATMGSGDVRVQMLLDKLAYEQVFQTYSDDSLNHRGVEGIPLRCVKVYV